MSVSRVFSHDLGVDRIVPYAVQVATAQLVFDDGEKLEGRGVNPDHPCVPTAEDQQDERDPCLEFAHRLAQQALGISEAQP